MILLTIESLLILAYSAGRRTASETNKNITVARKVSMIGGRFGGKTPKLKHCLRQKMMLDNRVGGSTIEISPPIPVRIEWADSQGRVTASWLAAHFKFWGHPRGQNQRKNMTTS